MTERKHSMARIIWRQYRQRREAILGLHFVLLLFVVALTADLLASDHPYVLRANDDTTFPILEEMWPFSLMVRYPEFQAVNLRTLAEEEGNWAVFPPIRYSPTEYDLDAILEAPNSIHWLGTDDQGRDVVSRLVHGSRVSLAVGFVAVSIYVAMGIILGALAGYYGGVIDIIISRLVEIMICFPTFFLILAILAFVGPSIWNIMIVIGLTGWTGIARLVRGEFLKLREQDFVVASRALGVSDTRLIARHILPNALAPVLVSATFGIASAILIESALSFLGFGVQPPTPSWGDILSLSRNYIDFAWWLTFAPGCAIFLTVTCYNLVGEGLRDAIDPRLREVADEEERAET